MRGEMKKEENLIKEQAIAEAEETRKGSMGRETAEHERTEGRDGK
jgi:hypothetical protein